MTRMLAPQRREAIIAAAQKVLLAKGLVAATTRDVTEELGVGVGLLSHYFSWTELRALAFERIVRSDLDRSICSRREERAATVLRDVIESAFDPSSDPLWRLLLEATELASSDPSLSQIVATFTDRWWEELAGLLSRGHAERAWSCSDPTGASCRIIALLHGLSGLALVPGARLSREEATHHLKTAIGHECQVKVRPRKRR